MLKTEKIERGLSIYDYANVLYGGFDNIISLVLLNPDFVNMDVDMDTFAAKEITYDDANYVSRAPQLQLGTSSEAAATEASSRDGQSVYDLNLMLYSSLDHVVKFCIDNGINSINDQRLPVAAFTFESKLNTDLSLKKIIEKKGEVFATSTEDSDYRITEAEAMRITEDGHIRILE